MNSNPPRRQENPLSVSLSIAFAVGAAVGAGMALLMTPHSGGEMRRRIICGVKTAQGELGEVIEETRGAVEALTKDARQTLRYTALRLTDVASATKHAFQADAGVPERMSADE